MKTNPFASVKQNPCAQEGSVAGAPPGSGSDHPPASDSERVDAAMEAGQPTQRFLKRAGLAAGAFLVVVLFVSREIHHTRELYQMSRLVALAEAEKRQWQEKQRLEEVRTAGLVAALHSQQAAPQNIQLVKAAYTFPAGRR